MSLEFNDDNNKPLSIDAKNKPIEFWIARNKNFKKESFEKINVTSLNHSTNTLFYQRKITMNVANISIHIQLKPLNLSSGYIIIFKYGDTPSWNSNTKYFDSFKVFCPSKGKIYF